MTMGLKKNVTLKIMPEANDVYEKLEECIEESDKVILGLVLETLGILKRDFHYGRPVPKKLIPKEYVENYGIENLFQFEISPYYRISYSIVNGATKTDIVIFVLEIQELILEESTYFN